MTTFKETDMNYVASCDAMSLEEAIECMKQVINLG